MAEHPIAKLEAVAAVIAKADGFVVASDGHGEGQYPIVNMSKAVERNGKMVPPSPRAMSYVSTAREVLDVLKGRRFAKVSGNE